MVTKAQPLIAIVDDEESIRKALGRLLRSACFDAAAYPSGGEFLESLAVGRPDCLLLDLHMPDINGFEVLERLAALRLPLPVIVITGHDQPGNAERVRTLGAADYLLKPVNDELMLGAIQLALAHKSTS